MTSYSPVLATYGVRVDQLLETAQDFARYHEKLNKKLQKLRHRCQLITKDTRRYAAKEKYSNIASEDYDQNNKLFGVLVLLHAERDLAMAEILKLRARQRGKLKKSERKVIGSRLKRALQSAEKLVDLTQNESQWSTRVQYLLYAKLASAEYLTHGKLQKNKNSGKISQDLALSFAALDHLHKLSILSEGVLDLLHAKYEYTLKQHADSAFSSTELQNFVVQKVMDAQESDDEMVKLIVANGYKPQMQVSKGGASVKEIQWRAFTAKIYDPQVEALITESNLVAIKGAPDYDTKLLKWQQALEKQETRIASQDEEEEDSQEDDQILLSYIKCNALFTSILRDNYLFSQLWQQWNKLDTSMASRVTKCKEIDRIVKNLQKYLQDVMELPGIYQDDELMAQLELSKLYFQLSFTSGCLGGLYQLKGRYLESLALHVDAHHKLEDKLANMEGFQEVLVPAQLLSHKKVTSLQQLIKTGWKSVASLAEYEKLLKEKSQGLYQPALVERLDSGRISPADVKLSNIFPLRPKLRPVPSKPSLFDLAFNYMTYHDESSKSSPSGGKSQATAPEAQEDITGKKRGFLGLFRG